MDNVLIMSQYVPARWPAPGPALAGQGAAGGDQAQQHGAGRGAGAGQHLGHGAQTHQTRQVRGYKECPVSSDLCDQVHDHPRPVPQRGGGRLPAGGRGQRSRRLRQARLRGAERPQHEGEGQATHT